MDSDVKAFGNVDHSSRVGKESQTS
jgi:hypothetical protein